MFKNMFSKNKLQERELSFYFAVISSFFMSAILIIITVFVGHYVKTISAESDDKAKLFNSSLSDLMVNSYADNKHSGNLEQLDTIAINLYNSDVLAYAYIVDNISKKIIWSINKDDIGQSEQYGFLDNINNINTSTLTQEVSKSIGTEVMKMGFTTAEMQRNELETLFVNVRILFIIILILAIVASMFMGQVFKKPFEKLIDGIKGFGAGNFDKRLELTPFVEINKIVDSYNFMAFQLNELYQSLELKVQERTIELEQANLQIKEAQSMLVHSEKMRSLGELVAGIAHEINNPINFIHGNIIHLERYSHDLIRLIKTYEKYENVLSNEILEELKGLKEEIELDFLEEDIDELIKSCKEGTERTKNIVLDLKNFSRLDEMVFTEMDIPKEIDTTLNILKNKVKNKAVVIKEYEENLPKIEAYGGQLNQVFMNILDNAIYAIKEEKGEIKISSRRINDDKIIIEFSDNGVGISEENLKKIMDPFYTTKPVGEGTGLGMSIAYKVIANHGGNIDITSKLGVGTTVKVTLPINQEKENNGKKV